MCKGIFCMVQNTYFITQEHFIDAIVSMAVHELYLFNYHHLFLFQQVHIFKPQDDITGC